MHDACQYQIVQNPMCGGDIQFRLLGEEFERERLVVPRQNIEQIVGALQYLYGWAHDFGLGCISIGRFHSSLTAESGVNKIRSESVKSHRAQGHG